FLPPCFINSSQKPPPPSGPVSPVELIVDRVDSSSSESCDLHVTCRTHNAHISSTVSCFDRVCIQEGGERPEVTTSGASLQVHLLNNVIICNHSNQVHRTHDLIHAEQLCYQSTGTIVTPVFVLKGRDLLLKLDADPPERVLIVDWKINKTVTLRIASNGKPNVLRNSTGGFEFPENKFSVILKNVQEVDSGVYSAEAGTLQRDKLAEYKVTVQGPVSPVELIVDRVDNSSESCDLHVTCRTHNSNINSTFSCVDWFCSQEGGERPEVTTSGASLQVYLSNNVIICNHSNQVHWTHDFDITEHLCPSNPAEHLCSDHAGSVFLVKMVVFSVGLIIMVSAVITVHLVDFKKHQQRNGCQTRHAAREESSHLKVTF
uniref:Immunoglobulin subtype domain-containing protein n=1 Tax=Gasterosteus aculeatus aculeatus TaxID=481459 RepID=A0AAQ4NMB3_GASAC